MAYFGSGWRLKYSLSEGVTSRATRFRPTVSSGRRNEFVKVVYCAASIGLPAS